MPSFRYQYQKKAPPLEYTSVETLERAKKILTDHGWQRGNLGHGTGPHCIVGAVIEVDGYRNYYQVMSFIGSALGVETQSDVMRWNDRLWRRKDAVLKMFDRAIELAKEKNMNIEEQPNVEPVFVEPLPESMPAAPETVPEPISVPAEPDRVPEQVPA